MEQLLAGNWECVQACPEESMTFGLRAGQHTFASFLRDRQAVVGATWVLDEGRITVLKGDAPVHEWEIVTLTRVRLEVKTGADQPNAVFRRSLRN
jgi:hypothetical protein